MAADFSIVSYNLHGFGSGLGMLPDLCKLHTVITVQEHWLSDDGLMKLNDIYMNCRSYAVSAMMGVLCSCFGFIDTLYNSCCSCKFVICGDMNFPCDNDNPGFVQAHKTFRSLNIICCDELIVGDRSTSINNSLGHRSSLDHFLVSGKIKRDLDSDYVPNSVHESSDYESSDYSSDERILQMVKLISIKYGQPAAYLCPSKVESVASRIAYKMLRSGNYVFI